ncbi:MAG: hypothetical protein ACFE94_02620 [Candidatus Hodarchaeota archaeon]
MVVSSQFKNKGFHDILICGICHGEITQEAAIFQEGLHFGVICSECFVNNSENDIELMSNMFLAFGGFFGMLRDPDYSIYEMLKDLIGKIHDNKKSITSVEMKIRLLHIALLHGITPREFAELDNGLLKFMYQF